MCYHIRGAWTYVRGPKFGDVGTRPLGMWTCLTRWKYASFELRHRAKFRHSSSNRTSDYDYGCLPGNVPPSRSLKVIGTDTDRSATYDFQFVFHSNYGPISYTVSEIMATFTKFLHPLYSTPCSPCSPWNFITALGSKQTGMTPVLEC